MSSTQIINSDKKLSISDIKSKVILKKILSNLNENKFLNIIHYNKTLQNILDIDINDFKNASQIKLVITLHDLQNIYPFYTEHFNKNTYGNYINIYNNQSHYHVEKIDDKTINILLDYEINSLSRLFQRCHYIKKIDFIQFKRKNIIDMSYMFHDCQYLEEINFSNFITDNVENMNHMFYGCELLKELNLSNFNTSKVTNMCDMFERCLNLTKLNLSNFDTSNVTNMNFMFYGCRRLKEINILEFNTSNVKYMNNMFRKCSSLEDTRFLYLDTSKASDKKGMFHECKLIIKFL